MLSTLYNTSVGQCPVFCASQDSHSSLYSELLNLITEPHFTHPINSYVPTTIHVTDCQVLKYDIHLSYIQRMTKLLFI